MIDLDLVDVGSTLTITTSEGKDMSTAELYATHNADKGYAILLRATNNTAGGKVDVVDVAIDRKAAKMIINYLQTIYEL